MAIRIFFLLTFFYGWQILHIKAEIDLFVEDAATVFVNSKYFDADKTFLTADEGEDGKNTLSGALVLLKTLPETTEMHINLLKYASGEYKQPTGIDITTDLCTAFEDDVLLGPILEINGMTSDDCPLEPGSLAIDHYTPKQDLFPDSFPEGKYQMLMEMSNQGEDLFKAKLYLYVEEV